jgi:hypothetical protein
MAGPSSADDAAMLGAIGDEEGFAHLSDRRFLDELFAVIEEIVYRRRSERLHNRARRLRGRDTLVRALARTLEVLNDAGVAFDAACSLTYHYHDDFEGGLDELRTFQAASRRLLTAAKAIEPAPSRASRGEEQFRTHIARQEEFLLISLLERYGIRVGATGGEGGPGSRLLARLLRLTGAGYKPTPDTVKRRVRRARG